jgi:hypothetical protein
MFIKILVINKNGHMQLGCTVCNDFPTVVAQPVISTTVGQAVPQQNILKV